MLEQLIKPKNIKSVVIPTSIATENVKKVEIPNITKPEVNKDIVINNLFEDKKETTNEIIQDNETEPVIETLESEVPQKKKGRGRPRKNPPQEELEPKVKRGRGRPKNNKNQKKY